MAAPSGNPYGSSYAGAPQRYQSQPPAREQGHEFPSPPTVRGGVSLSGGASLSSSHYGIPQAPAQHHVPAQHYASAQQNAPSHHAPSHHAPSHHSSAHHAPQYSGHQETGGFRGGRGGGGPSFRGGRGGGGPGRGGFQPQFNSRKMKICMHFTNGTCQRSKEQCNFAHGEEDLAVGSNQAPGFSPNHQNPQHSHHQSSNHHQHHHHQQQPSHQPNPHNMNPAQPRQMGGNPYQQTDPPSEKLFVANIPPYITQPDLGEIFGKFGLITNCHVPEGKSFAFVQFDTLESAEQAVAELNGKDLTGAGSKKLVVKYQKNKPKPEHAGPEFSGPSPARKSRFEAPAGPQGPAGGMQMVSYDPDAPTNLPASEMPEPAVVENPAPPADANRVFAEGLVAARIAAARIAAQSAETGNDDENINTQIGQIAIYNPDKPANAYQPPKIDLGMPVNAFQSSDQPFDSSKAFTFEDAAPEPRKSRFEDQSYEQQKNEIDRDHVKIRNILNNPHLPEDKKKRLIFEITRKASGSQEKNAPPQVIENQLFIANLHPETRQYEVEQRFKKFGEIVSCKVVLDEISGNSKGYGFISFEQSHEAKVAMRHMNGQPNKEDPEAATKALVVRFKDDKNGRGPMPVAASGMKRSTGQNTLKPMSSANKPYNPNASQAVAVYDPYAGASRPGGDIESAHGRRKREEEVKEEKMVQHVYIPIQTYERLASQNTLEKLKLATQTQYQIRDLKTEKLLIVAGEKDKVECLVEVLTSTIDAFPGLPKLRIDDGTPQAPADPKQAYFEQASGKRRKRRWRDEDEKNNDNDNSEEKSSLPNAVVKSSLADQWAQYQHGGVESDLPNASYGYGGGEEGGQHGYGEYGQNTGNSTQVGIYDPSAQSFEKKQQWSSQGGSSRGYSSQNGSRNLNESRKSQESGKHQEHQQFWETQQGQNYGL